MRAGERTRLVLAGGSCATEGLGLWASDRNPGSSLTSPFLHLPNPSPDPSPPKGASPIPVSSSPLLASVTLLRHPRSCPLTSPLQPSVPLPVCFPCCIHSGYLKCSEVTPLLKTPRRRCTFLGTRILSTACRAPCDLASPSVSSAHTVPGVLAVLWPRSTLLPIPGTRPLSSRFRAWAHAGPSGWALAVASSALPCPEQGKVVSWGGEKRSCRAVLSAYFEMSDDQYKA